MPAAKIVTVAPDTELLGTVQIEGVRLVTLTVRPLSDVTVAVAVSP